ncbi:hypothetical protein [Rhodoblastus sp.]|uniref:hypothetical protein n=1 Tax=Rhodoblastus sp. TaxID=1962975 RepID=UPI0035ADFD43
MTKAVAFGRRGLKPLDRASPAPAFAEPALTPEQRAVLFGAEHAPAPDESARATRPPRRRAALIACLAVTALVSAVTLVGQPHDVAAGLPPLLADQAAPLLRLAGGWFEPLLLALSVISIASNCAANLWFAEKFCGLREWTGVPAFALSGAVTSVALAQITALIGMGGGEWGIGFDALTGAGVAALYRLLAGRSSFE